MFEKLGTAALACIINLLLLVAVPLAFIVLLAARSGDDAGRSRRDISDFANTGTHFAWTASPIRHEVGSSRLKVAAELDL